MTTDDFGREIFELYPRPGVGWWCGRVPTTATDLLTLKALGVNTIFNLGGWSIPRSSGFEIINHPLCFESLTMPMTISENEQCANFFTWLSIADKSAGLYLCGEGEDALIVATILAARNNIKISVRLAPTPGDARPNKMMREGLIEKYSNPPAERVH